MTHSKDYYLAFLQKSLLGCYKVTMLDPVDNDEKDNVMKHHDQRRLHRIRSGLPSTEHA